MNLIVLTTFILSITTISAEVPYKWRRFNTFDVNNNSYALWYWGDADNGYGDAQSIFTGITQKCANVSFPGSLDTPVYWGISSNQQNDVMLYSNHVNTNDNVQLCISSFFAQGIANSASSIKNIVYLTLLPIIVMLI